MTKKQQSEDSVVQSSDFGLDLDVKALHKWVAIFLEITIPNSKAIGKKLMNIQFNVAIVLFCRCMKNSIGFCF